eukprot:scaffold4084_cov78-Isochrysis_galbana.AAC.2
MRYAGGAAVSSSDVKGKQPFRPVRTKASGPGSREAPGGDARCGASPPVQRATPQALPWRLLLFWRGLAVAPPPSPPPPRAPPQPPPPPGPALPVDFGTPPLPPQPQPP